MSGKTAAADDQMSITTGKYSTEFVENKDVVAQKPTLAPLAEVADEETARYTNADIVVTEDDNRRIRKLLNRRILPIMLVTYFCQTLDKSTLAFSSIMGIKEDTHLVGQDYSWLGTILYFGILAGELPINRLIQHAPLAKLLGLLIFLWGVTVMCHAACTDFKTLMVVRFLLGFFESGVQPCLMTITAMYYKREEHAQTISFWYSMQGLQLMVGGLMAFGVSHIQNAKVQAWQVLFFIVGGFSLWWAACVWAFLPDSPMTAKCWTEEEKTLMIERKRKDELGIKNKEFKWSQVKEALLDPLIWCYFFLQFTSFVVVNGLSVFSNIIVKGLGFSVLQTQLLNIAQGALSIAIFIGSAWLAKKTDQTLIVMALWLLPAIAGTVVLLAIKVTPQNAPGMLIAFYCTQFVIGEGNLIFSVFLRNVAGQTKKTVTTALCFIAYASGAIVGPQLFQATDSPRYTKAWICHLCLHGAFMALCMFTGLLLMRRNAKKRGNSTSDGSSPDENFVEEIQHKNAFADLTDKQNPDFRYVY